MKQGNKIDEWTRTRCAQLLQQTDLTMSAIGVRLGISQSTVKVINKEFQIREYAGRHATFTRTDGVVVRS